MESKPPSRSVRRPLAGTVSSTIPPRRSLTPTLRGEPVSSTIHKDRVSPAVTPKPSRPGSPNPSSRSLTPRKSKLSLLLAGSPTRPPVPGARGQSAVSATKLGTRPDASMLTPPRSKRLPIVAGNGAPPNTSPQCRGRAAGGLLRSSSELVSVGSPERSYRSTGKSVPLLQASLPKAPASEAPKLRRPLGPTISPMRSVASISTCASNSSLSSTASVMSSALDVSSDARAVGRVAPSVLPESVREAPSPGASVQRSTKGADHEHIAQRLAARLAETENLLHMRDLEMAALNVRLKALEQEGTSKERHTTTWTSATSVDVCTPRSCVNHSAINQLDMTALCSESESIIQRLVDTECSEPHLRRAVEENLRLIREELASRRNEEHNLWQNLRNGCVVAQKER